MASPRIISVQAGTVRDRYGDADLMRLLLTVEGRGSKWDEIGEAVLGRIRA